MSDSTSSRAEGVKLLRTLPYIRKRCADVRLLAREGKLRNFQVEEEKLKEAAMIVKLTSPYEKEFYDIIVDWAYMDKDVTEVMESTYASPNDVPEHSRLRNFEVGGIDRIAMLRGEWKCSRLEHARRLVDLVVSSVLLDAGAGSKWKFDEPGTSVVAGSSEGLALASLHLFKAGGLSSNNLNPYQCDSSALRQLSLEVVASSFQVSDSNPLLGFDNRVELLNRLGNEILHHPAFFLKDGISRPGHLVDYLLTKLDATTGRVSIEQLWEAIIYGFEGIWPTGRTLLDGRNMGDVWHHRSLQKDGTNWGQLIPFHKLSQWLAYSLLEPLKVAGIELYDLELLTGLPEYRNGGLFVDTGVLVPVYSDMLKQAHEVHSEGIVEWRALTVCLLDELYTTFLELTGMSRAEFSLGQMLEAGSWKAGRILAERRDPIDRSSPIKIVSDGTVF